MELKEIIEDLNVSILDVETLKLENPDSLDLSRAVGQLKACRASLCAFNGKFQSQIKEAK
jgi:hypothetical protein